MQSVFLKYFPEISEEKHNRLLKFQELITEWNNSINLVSKKDIENLDVHHILHALAIAKFTNFSKDSKILDIGTGGGFPGIPLAIMFPEVQFTLIDSIGKKIMVVNDIVQKLGLTNVNARQIRAEELKEKFDFVVSRGVSSFDKFMRFIEGKFSNEEKNALPNGLIYLKGGDVESELAELKMHHADVFEIQNYFEEEFFETKKVVYIPQ